MVVVLLATLSLAYGSSFDLDGFDSAELALVAVTAGLGHPPGQPLHTILGWLLTRIGSAQLIILTLLSIVPTGIVFAFGTASFARGQTDAIPSEKPDSRSLWQNVVCVLVAVVGVTLGPVRDVATRVEVYALAAMFVMIAVHFAQSSHRFRHAITGALLGCAAATNPVVAAQGLGVLWLFWLRKTDSRAASMRAVIVCGLSALMTLGVCYLYAFNAVSRDTQTLVWSAPTDLRSFISVIFARDFSQNISISVGSVLGNVGEYGLSLLRSGCGVWLLLGLVGLILKDSQGRRDSLWPVAILATVVGVLMVAANGQYRANNPDYGGYVLLACGLCTKGVLRLLFRRAYSEKTLAILSCLLAILSVMATLRQGRSAGVVRSLAMKVLETAPSNALLVVGADHLLFPVLYLQRVEGVRRDVTVLNPGWASSGWAWKWAQSLDRTLVVDLRRGVGREARLLSVLQNRANRAVISETPDIFAQLHEPSNSVCPRGILWSSREGCDASTRSTRATADWLRALRQRADARRDVWGQRLVRHTAVLFGDGLRRVGCSGVSVRIYAAGLGQVSPVWPPSTHSNCGFAARMNDPEPDILLIDDEVLSNRLASTQRDRPIETP